VFAKNCRKNRVDPKRTLEKILLGTPDPAAYQEVYDIELGAAGLRLALESQSEFLLYLSEQKQPDGTFASEIARLLGPKIQWRKTGGDRSGRLAGPGGLRRRRCRPRP
jgi:hypothetical protein